MKIIFIADAHLRARDSQSYDNLMSFLQGLDGRNGEASNNPPGSDGPEGNGNGSIKIDALYILGDFFDFWFCRREDVYPEFADIIERLSELKARGVKICLCEGNHDFFLSDYFVSKLGMEVITDWAVIKADGKRVLVSHGDRVDGRNVRYLFLRKILRSRFFYRLQRVLPLPFLWKVARFSSNMSKELTGTPDETLARKMRAFSLRKFRDGFDAVVLGHCHKHLIEEIPVNGSRKTFVILGDWIKHNTYLSYVDGEFRLDSFRHANNRKL